MYELLPDEDVVFAFLFDVHTRAVVEEDGEWAPPAPSIRFFVIDAVDIDW